MIMSATLTNFAFPQSKTDSRKKEFNISKEGIAIEGYDPVSYFSLHKAIKGKKEFSVNAGGIIYRFSGPEDQKIFKEDPSAYEPQFGGWGAYAMGSTGSKVEVDPETFKISDGKLYLFYNRFFNNTLKSWNKDEVNLKTKADINWAKIIH
jgi:hypothetical protein